MLIRYQTPVCLRTYEIIAVLGIVYSLWFPDMYYHSFWFSNEYDDYIREKFCYLLMELSSMALEELLLIIDSSPHPKRTAISIIVCIDQFTRNIYRGTDNITRNDSLCYKLVRYLYNQNFDLDLPINQRIFFFLSFRHQRNTQLANIVLANIPIMTEYNDTECKTNAKLHNSNRNILLRFLKETIKGMTIHNDNIRIHDTGTNNTTETYLLSEEILDPECKYTELATSVGITEEVIYYTFCKFVTKHNIKKFVFPYQEALILWFHLLC